MIVNVLVSICVPDVRTLTFGEDDLRLDGPVHRDDAAGYEAPIVI